MIKAIIFDCYGVLTVNMPSPWHKTLSNKPLLSYIQQLKNDYKIGILSNAGSNRLNEFLSPAEIELFEVVALSYDIGAVKPDVMAYETAAERLGVLASECLFVDDQLGYCEAAKGAGMRAIHYQNFEQCVAELEAIIS